MLRDPVAEQLQDLINRSQGHGAKNSSPCFIKILLPRGVFVYKRVDFKVAIEFSTGYVDTAGTS